MFEEVIDSIVSASLDGYDDIRTEAEDLREEEKKQFEARREERKRQRELANDDKDEVPPLTVPLPLVTESKDTGEIPIGFQPSCDPRNFKCQDEVKVGTEFLSEHKTE